MNRRTFADNYAVAGLLPQLLAFRELRANFFHVGNFFKPNIGSRGRLVRGGIAILFFIAGGMMVFYLWWLGLIFIGIGIFVLFEALRGWCLARACGVKMKI